MEIERSITCEIEEVRSPLERLYQTVPRWQDIVAAVRAGEAEFKDFLAKAGLLERGISTSVVHPDHDIDGAGELRLKVRRSPPRRHLDPQMWRGRHDLFHERRHQ